MKKIDLTGRVFGRLTVLSLSHRTEKHGYWNCVCECGKESIVAGDNLHAGHTKSCGCITRRLTPFNQKEYLKVYVKTHHDRILELRRKYRESHLEQSREWARKYIHSHPGKIKAARDALPSCYHSWTSMRQRCDNPTNKRFYMYGAKGITYKTSWKSFDVFYADMGDKPKGYDLHRKDSAKGYSKSNCIWLSKSEHSRTTRAKNRKST